MPLGCLVKNIGDDFKHGMVIPGSLNFYTIRDSNSKHVTPILLNDEDQKTLGLIKDKRTNAVCLSD